MRSQWTVLAAAAATLWVAPQLAVAGDDVEAQIRQMNERMAQMEQQLQATNEELAASKQRVEQQQAVLQDLDEDRQASSGLSKFLSETEFSGLVAASYTYNFKNFNNSAVGRNGNSTTGGENLGVYGLTAPHHSNSNNFQVDQLAFRMKKTPTPESRAGWGASLTWGASADSLAGRSPGFVLFDGPVSTGSDATGDLPELTEAYAAYLFDIGSGVKLVGGRYMTPVGAESFFMNENFNVTRGLLWALQPVNHTGAYIGGDCECGLSWQLGASNSYGNTMADTDTEPTFVGSVGYKMDTLGFRVNGVYGGNVDDLFGGLGTFGAVGAVETGGGFLVYNTGNERNSDKIGLLDAVLTWDPSDSLSTWVNFDYYWTADTGHASGPPPFPAFQDLSGLTIYGIAAAGRYAITEATGFALRYEWLYFNDYSPIGSDAELMSLTATLDHRLTDNLVVSAEGRWDRGRAQDVPDDIYLGDVSGNPAFSGGLDFGDFINDGSNHQVLGLVQLRYEF
jgi:Sec-independent protein translocase protein TatA